MGKCPICGKGFAYSFNKANDGTQVCAGNSCKTEYNKILLQGGGVKSTNSESNQSQTSNEEKKSGGGFLSGFMGGGEDSASKVAQTQLLGSLLADSMNENKDIRAKVDAVAKMVFSTDANELANQMNELLTIGAGTASEHKELIKACYEKMDFGVMKLRGLGANAEADFFSEKRKSIKPKGMFGF
jgi:hypothetical protein